MHKHTLLHTVETPSTAQMNAVPLSLTTTQYTDSDSLPVKLNLYLMEKPLWHTHHTHSHTHTHTHKHTQLYAMHSQHSKTNILSLKYFLTQDFHLGGAVSWSENCYLFCPTVSHQAELYSLSLSFSFSLSFFLTHTHTHSHTHTHTHSAILFSHPAVCLSEPSSVGEEMKYAVKTHIY